VPRRRHPAPAFRLVAVVSAAPLRTPARDDEQAPGGSVIPLSRPRRSSNRSAGKTSCPRPRLAVPGGPALRWLADAEADHGRAILRRRAAAHQLGAGAAAAEEVDGRGPRLGRWCPARQGRCSGGWRRTRPQTELAESEERDPPTGPARHRLRANGTAPRQRRQQSVDGGLEPVRVVAPAVLHLPSRECARKSLRRPDNLSPRWDRGETSCATSRARSCPRRHPLP
jgi:hypothetical protein